MDHISLFMLLKKLSLLEAYLIISPMIYLTKSLDRQQSLFTPNLISGERAGKVEDRGEAFISFRHLYNLCMVSIERGSSKVSFHGMKF